MLLSPPRKAKKKEALVQLREADKLELVSSWM